MIPTSKTKKQVVGMKFDSNKSEKPSISLIPTKPLFEIAKVLDFGKEKYAAHNWRNGIDSSRLTDAALRHILLDNEGTTTDDESGLLHLAHAACMILFALEQRLRSESYKDFDDRYDATQLKD